MSDNPQSVIGRVVVALFQSHHSRRSFISAYWDSAPTMVISVWITARSTEAYVVSNDDLGLYIPSLSSPKTISYICYVNKISYLCSAMHSKLMGKHKHYLCQALLCLFAALMSVACTNEMKDRLLLAESLSTVNPDSTFAILDGIDREKLPGKECRQLYDLAWAEAYYMQTKDVPDSIENILSHMETTPGTSQHLIKKILRSAYMFWQDDVTGAFDSFKDCRRELDMDIPLYWKAVVEDYLGIISLRAGYMEECRNHFHKVLDYAMLMNDKNAITSAHSHLIYYYYTVTQLDTALYYASMVVEECDRQDSQMLAMTYNNLARIQMALSEAHSPEVIDKLKLSKKLYSDIEFTSSLMARAYYLLGKPDSAQIYQIEVDGGNSDYAKLDLYKFLSDYYQRSGERDSAYKYLRLRNHMDSVCMRYKPVEAILNTAHRYELEEIERKASRRQVWIISISVFVILSVTSLLVFRYTRSMAKARRLFKDTLDEKDKLLSTTEWERQSTVSELGTVQEQLHGAQSALEEARLAMSRAGKKSGDILDGPASASRKPADTKRGLSAQDLDFLQDFLDKSIPSSLKPNKAFINKLTAIYMESGDDRRHFVQFLNDNACDLTPTGMLICILYNEGFCDEEIASKIASTSQAFRVAKSRAYAAIRNISAREDAIVRQLMQKFDGKGA